MPAGSNAQIGGVLDPSKDLDLTGAVTSRAGITAYGPSAAIGYSGAAPGGSATGGTVTQLTNRTTAVTLNTICGAITTNTASLAAEAAAAFTVNNSLVAIGDVVVVCQRSGSNGGDTEVSVTTVAAGSFAITVANNNASGGTAETGAIIINFAVVKAVTT